MGENNQTSIEINYPGWRSGVVLKNDRYTYRVTGSEDDNEYVGLCAEFPSLSQ